MRARLESPALKRVGTLMGGTVMGQVAVLAVTPMLTRLYTPQAFNDFGVYLALSGVFSVIATLRLEAAIPVAQDDGDAINLTRIALWTSGVVALLAAMLTETAIGLGWLKVQTNSWLMASLIGCSVFLIGAFQAISALQIRHDGFGVIARAKTVQGFASAAGQVLLGLLAPVPAALVAGDVGSRMTGLGSAFGLYRSERRQQPFQATRTVLRQYRKFPQYSAPAALINSLGLQAPILLLGAFLNPTAVGLYVFANRLVAVPVSLLARTLSQVFLGEIGKARLNRRPMQPIVTRYVLGGAGATGLLVLSVLPFTKWLVPALFGQEWLSAVPILNALLLLSIPQIAASTVSQTMNATGHNSWQLCWDIMRLVVVASVIVCTSAKNQELLLSIEAYSLASSAAYGLLLAMTYVSLNIAGDSK